MNLESVINRSSVVQNPNFDPDKKKNTEQPYITAPTIQNAQNFRPAESFTRALGSDYGGQFGSEYDKYVKVGLTPSRVHEFSEYNDEAAKYQKTSTMWGNALKRAIVSETLIGTVKGFSDIFDGIVNAITPLENDDYTNPVSRYLKEQQEKYEAEHEIFTTGSTILNGGLLEGSWWASNFPSIFSTLTLLIPGMAMTKATNFVFKGLNLSQKTARGMQFLSKKWLASAVTDAEKISQLNWVNGLLRKN